MSECKSPHFVTAWLYLADLLHKAIYERNVFGRWRDDCIPDGTKSPFPTAPQANNSSENMSGSMSHLILEGWNQFRVGTPARCSYLDKTGGMFFFFSLIWKEGNGPSKENFFLLFFVLSAKVRTTGRALITQTSSVSSCSLSTLG